MKYDLANQLKEAGFRQDGNGFALLLDKPLPESDQTMREIPWVQYVHIGAASDNPIYAPTLSELIEACGDNFGGLVWCQIFSDENGSSKEWVAFPFMAREDEHLGSTPEDAVAELWLALHNSK